MVVDDVISSPSSYFSARTHSCGRGYVLPNTGHALLDVALSGNHIDDARDRLRKSVNSYPPEQARARAFSLGKLAILELMVGDATQGIVYAERALDAEAPLKSRRAKDDLVEMSKALTKRAKLPGATELHSRIGEALKAG